MWSNRGSFFLLLVFFMSLTSENLPASTKNSTHKVSEYKFEKPMRLYHEAWTKEDGYGVLWGSILVPKGMVLKQIYSVEPFRDGIKYQQDDTDVFEYLEGVREDESGEKRLLYLKIGWRAVAKSHEFATMSDKKLLSLAKSAVTSPGVLIRDGEFSFPGAQGYYGLVRFGSRPNPEQWWKSINIYSRKFGATFHYIERDPETSNAIDSQKWKFESVADEIIKSFKFEKLPKEKSKK